MGHVLMENRHGLAVEATLTHATGTAEREATLVMLGRRTGKHRTTLGADKAYDVTDFVGDPRARGVTPHIAVNGTVSKLGRVRETAIDAATTRHPGYHISQRCRKRIDLRRENGLPDRLLSLLTYGWIKAAAGFASVKVRVPRDDGQSFHAMMGTDSTRSWAAILRVLGQV